LVSLLPRGGQARRGKKAREKKKIRRGFFRADELAALETRYTRKDGKTNGKGKRKMKSGRPLNPPSANTKRSSLQHRGELGTDPGSIERPDADRLKSPEGFRGKPTCRERTKKTGATRQSGGGRL